MTPADRHTDADLDELERSIRQSRTHITQAREALARRLDLRHLPRKLRELTMNRMSDRMSHGASSMGDMVRNHPVPLAMIGIGLGWLLLTGTGASERVTHSETARRMRERASETARYARDRYEGTRQWMSGVAHEQNGRVSGSMEEARGRMESTGRSAAGFWDMVDDHPLVAGVMAVALGAALGAGIPSSRTEDRWMGDYADEMGDRARHAAEAAYERGSGHIQSAAEALRQEAAAAAEDAGQAAREEMGRSSA